MLNDIGMHLLPEQLIAGFIHVLGKYPVGTVFELSSGELAIILKQNDSQRLFPLMTMTTNVERKLLQSRIECDLSKHKGTLICRL